MDTSPPTRFYALSFLVKTLRDSLLEGRWSHTLPPERELALELRVSRFTLRNALRVLEEEGIIIIAQGKPTRISIPEALGPRPKPFKVNLVRVSSEEEPNDAEMIRISQEIQLRLHEASIPCRVLCGSPAAIRRNLETAHSEYKQGGERNLSIVLTLTPALEDVFTAQPPGTTLLVRSGSLNCPLPYVDMHLEAIGRHLGTLAGHRDLRKVAFLSLPATKNRAAHVLAGFNKTRAQTEAPPESWIAVGDFLPNRLPLLLKDMEPQSLLALTSAELVGPVLFHAARGGLHIPKDFSLVCIGSPDLANYGVDLAFYQYEEAKIAKVVVQQIIDVVNIGGRGFRKHLLIPEYRSGRTMIEATRAKDQKTLIS